MSYEERPLQDGDQPELPPLAFTQEPLHAGDELLIEVMDEAGRINQLPTVAAGYMDDEILQIVRIDTEGGAEKKMPYIFVGTVKHVLVGSITTDIEPSAAARLKFNTNDVSYGGFIPGAPMVMCRVSDAELVILTGVTGMQHRPRVN